MKKIYIDTLGCAKNEYDSSVLVAELKDRGCEVTDYPEEADILIVNTCGFIDDAKQESIDRIFQLAFDKEDRKLVVTGCLSERYHNELAQEMPEVDMFFGVNDYEKLPDILLGESDNTDQDMVGDDLDDLKYRKRDFRMGSYTGVLKIAEGCYNACSFCAIPSIRGTFRSKRMEDCIREAQDMADAGIRELILIAQDTSQYGRDLYGKPALPKLLRELVKIDGIEWIRIMYVYDNGITDELIETIADEPKICNYIDIPIQHISDNVLNRMKRQSTSKSIRETVQRLRDRIPDIHIRTTVLVGFPGETEDDLNELLDFIDTMKIDRLGCFAFSDEEGTPSFHLDGKLDEETKQARRDMVMMHQLEISEELNENKIGKIFDVIVDEPVAEGMYFARTRYDAPEIDCNVTVITEDKLEPGDIVRVIITDAYEYDLEGVQL